MKKVFLIFLLILGETVSFTVNNISSQVYAQSKPNLRHQTNVCIQGDEARAGCETPNPNGPCDRYQKCADF